MPRIETYAYPLADMLDVIVDTYHLAVVSQSCDLENDKIDDVLLAAVLNYKGLTEREGKKNPTIKGRSWRKAAIRGDLASFSVLPVREEPPVFAWSLVDFHHLFTLPKGFVGQFAESCGARLRLVPPYREHLAQAFARYFMRVGLPSSLDAFEDVVD